MSEMFKGCKTFEVGSGVSSSPILHPPWCFVIVVGRISHSLDETEGGNDLEKPSWGYSNITFLAVVVLEAQPLPVEYSLGNTAMHLSSSGILPEAVTAAVP